MKVRSDLRGAVHVRTKNGREVLRAGDTVPTGVKLDKHLLEQSTRSSAPKTKEASGARGKPAEPADKD